MESNIFFKDINSKKEGNIYGTSPVPVPSDVINFGIGKISKAISNSDSNMVKFAYDENTDYTAIYVGNKLFTSKIVDSISELTGTNGTEENKGSKRNITFTKLNAATGEFTNDTFETIDSNWLENRISSLISTDEQYMTYMSDTSVRLKDVSANLHDTIYNLFEVSTYAYDTSININDVSTNLDKLRIYAENTSSNLKETNNTVNNIISNLYEVSTYTENVSTRFDDYKKSNDDYVKNISTRLDNEEKSRNSAETILQLNIDNANSSISDISTRLNSLIGTGIVKDTSYNNETNKLTVEWVAGEPTVIDLTQLFDLNDIAISDNATDYLSFEPNSTLSKIGVKLGNINEGTKGIASTDTVKTYVDESISNNKLIVIGDEYISAVSSENNKVTLTASDSIKTSILNADSAINEVAVGTNANTYVTNTKNVSTATFDFTVTPKNHFNDISTNQTNNLITASALAEAFTWHFLN